MRTVCLNRTQLTGAGVLNLDHRPHAAASIAVVLALALLSQQHALRKTFEYNAFTPTTPGPDCGFGFAGFVCASTSLDEFAPRSADLTLLLGTGGVKFNLGGNLLLSGSVLFPLTNAGLRSRVTTVFGADYAF